MKTFFITGVQRSGTTLLSVLLSNHPDIDLDGYSTAFRLISCWNNFEKIWPLNFQHPENEVLAWKIKNDYKGRLAEFLDYENLDKYPDFRSMVQASVERRLKEQGNKIWGDKSPNLQYYMPNIQLLFPNTKIIHIIRDGRAAALSHSVRAHKHILLAAQEWVLGNTAGLANQKMLGKKQHFILKYEELLTDPEKMARALCDFLEIPFYENMLNLKTGEGNNSYVKSKFDHTKIDYFKKEIPPNVLKKIERIQAPLLKKLGYQLVFPETEKNARPLSLLNWMRFRAGDSFRLLFRSKRMGMVNRKNVEVPLTLRNRLSKFTMNMAHDYLPKRAYEQFFEKAYNKDRYYKK